MSNFILSLCYIALGLVLGQTIRLLKNASNRRKNLPHEDEQPMPKLFVFLRNFALFGLNPIVVFAAFWVVTLENARLIALPFLGFGAMALGGLVAVGISKALHHEKRQTGAMFVSGSFTNLGTIGALVCFTFFGETCFAFVYMYKLFEEVYYYMIGYPIAKTFGIANDAPKRSFWTVLADPYVLVYFCSIVIGIILNLSGVQRPAFFADLSGILVPASSVILVTVIGYSMHLGKIKNYIRECLVCAGIKFIITPAAVALAALLIGLQHIENGLVFKVAVVMASMPTAFNALIPPQIYGLDKDLANSCWLFTTSMLIVVLPVLSLILT